MLGAVVKLRRGASTWLTSLDNDDDDEEEEIDDAEPPLGRIAVIRVGFPLQLVDAAVAVFFVALAFGPEAVFVVALVLLAVFGLERVFGRGTSSSKSLVSSKNSSTSSSSSLSSEML